MSVKQPARVIKPQPGYQLKALSSSADIVIGGGAAGTGKTFTLLMEPLRDIHNPNFGGVIFRRTTPMIRNEGGLWDSSKKLYSLIRQASPRESALQWRFASGANIKFAHLEYEKNIYDYQGSEIPFIGFDELTHFTKKMFFYLLSRNRSTSGVRPYVRATCNPDPDSFVRTFIDWWIGQDGFAIAERQGVLRYFMRDNDKYVWGDSKDEVIQKGAHVIDRLVEAAREAAAKQGQRSVIKAENFVKSLTFIGGSIYDNLELLKTDPDYLGNLNALNDRDKARLLGGNWNYKANSNDLYNYVSFMNMFSNDFLRNRYGLSERYITCDIAMKGSDLMVVYVWQGKMLIDFRVLPKTKGNEVIEAIQVMAIKHDVVNGHITFDNDGVGSFIDGFIENAREFNNGARALMGESYRNLKSQCYYKSAEAVNKNRYYIPLEIAERHFYGDRTLREQLLFERKAIKQARPNHDGKLAVIPKEEMKVILNNKSPDAMDAFMMREYLDLVPDDPIVNYS